MSRRLKRLLFPRKKSFIGEISNFIQLRRNIFTSLPCVSCSGLFGSSLFVNFIYYLRHQSCAILMYLRLWQITKCCVTIIYFFPLKILKIRHILKKAVKPCFLCNLSKLEGLFSTSCTKIKFVGFFCSQIRSHPP